MSDNGHYPGYNTSVLLHHIRTLHQQSLAGPPDPKHPQQAQEMHSDIDKMYTERGNFPITRRGYALMCRRICRDYEIPAQCRMSHNPVTNKPILHVRAL